MSTVTLRAANLADPQDCSLLARLTDAYARDAMGGGEGLPAGRVDELAQALSRQGNLFALIAEQDGEPLGHALCVLGFSSFYAKPVCNLHNLSVMPNARGKGIGRLLMQGVEATARERGCAKITLEVREDNRIGRQLYASEQYQQAGLNDAAYLMMEKRFLAK